MSRTQLEISIEAKNRRKIAYAMKQEGKTLREIGEHFDVGVQRAAQLVARYEYEAQKALVRKEGGEMWAWDGLSTRASNVLKNTDFQSESELLDMTRSLTEQEFEVKLSMLPACGRKTIKLIKEYCLHLEPTLWGHDGETCLR